MKLVLTCLILSLLCSVADAQLVTSPNPGGGASLVTTVQSLGATNAPSCNFNNGYICAWTGSAAQTLTFSNIPPANSPVSLIVTDTGEHVITVPGTFFCQTALGVFAACTAANVFSQNGVEIIPGVSNGTNIYFQVWTGNAYVNRLNAYDNVGFGGLTNAVTSGSAGAFEMLSGSLFSVTGGTPPTLTAGCNGTGSSVNASSTDNRGQFTSQTASATTCTLTFNHTWPQAPFCVCGDANSSTAPVACSVGAVGTGTVVFDFASTAARVWTYVCM